MNDVYDVVIHFVRQRIAGWMKALGKLFTTLYTSEGGNDGGEGECERGGGKRQSHETIAGRGDDMFRL